MENKPKLKIVIKEINTPSMKGFIGTLFNEYGSSIIREFFHPIRQGVIDELGSFATHYLHKDDPEKQE